MSGRDPTRSVGRDEVGTCSDEANSNQLYCFYILQRSFELLQETKVILKVIAEVANLPLEHRNTLHTHTECETTVLLAVDSRRLKDVRIHHTAAHDLKPAGTLADITSLSTADVAAYVNLSRRLCEREV